MVVMVAATEDMVAVMEDMVAAMEDMVAAMEDMEVGTVDMEVAMEDIIKPKTDFCTYNKLCRSILMQYYIVFACRQFHNIVLYLTKCKVCKCNTLYA